jgi:PTS system fructose-specific IIC component/PTS system nitrogen regulatory IIA component
MVLGTVFSPDLIKVDLESEDKEEVFEELIELYVSANPSSSRTEILSAVKKREDKLSTGIKTGVAIPHAQTSQVKTVSGVIGISRSGIDYDALDGKPVHVIFMLFFSRDTSALHLRVLKRLSLLLEDTEFYSSILNQKSPKDVYSTICRFEDILTTSM